ncbi:hypothetical protein BGY98DRAFT_263944 [Russula aff. rugulosa BPL654]|nr:hypothetical protein BGY98DRAFT_263944 [Russula aff. rugulosa BPL654]
MNFGVGALVLTWPLLILSFFFSSFLASSFTVSPCSTAATQDETRYTFKSQLALTALTSSPFFHTSRLVLSDNTYRHKAATTRQAYRRIRLYYTNPRHSRLVASMYIRQPSYSSRRSIAFNQPLYQFQLIVSKVHLWVGPTSTSILSRLDFARLFSSVLGQHRPRRYCILPITMGCCLS